MTPRRKRLCRDLATLARHTLLTDRHASIALKLLATSVELGTTESFARMAIEHATARLDEFRDEVNATLAEFQSQPIRISPSQN